MAGPSGDGLEFVFIEGVKFTGIRTPEEQRAFLQDTLSVFDGTGVRWDQMSPQEREKLGYTVDQFARAIKNINQFKDVDFIEKAWTAAMKGGGIAMMHRAKLLDVLRFSNWLKSAEGMKAMKAFAVEARFQRRATDTVNPLMVAKCGMLDQMYEGDKNWIWWGDSGARAGNRTFEEINWGEISCGYGGELPCICIRWAPLDHASGTCVWDIRWHVPCTWHQIFPAHAWWVRECRPAIRQPCASRT